RNVAAADRVAVDGRVVAGRNVERRLDVLGQHAIERIDDRDELRGSDGGDPVEDPILAVPNRNHVVSIALVITTRPAGFWIRAVAALLDFALFGLVKLSLGVLAGRVWRSELDGPVGVQGVTSACTMLFAVLYTIVLHALDGQTIGKLLVGVR